MKVKTQANTSSTASSLKTDVPKQGGLFQTVVFSRKNTSHGPDGDIRSAAKGSPTKKALAELTPSPLASIVHQADRNGKQSTALTTTTGARASTAQSPRQGQHGESNSVLNQGGGGQGGFRNLFANIWSALGISEQQAAAQKASSAKGSGGNAKSMGSSHNVVELRKSVPPPAYPQDVGKKCLVLDLDETLVHSSFKPTLNPDYIIPVDIDGTVHQVCVCKRPGAEEFLIEMAKHYEIVIYTASLSKYADPLLDRLDPEKVIRFRLFREHCVQYEGNYVKDLSLLDRDITQTVIIDNSPMSYLFHPRNAIGCSSFIDDMNDRELDSISRFLVDIRNIEDVRSQLHAWDAHY
ncbi:Nli interacting factor-like phosphatase, partial [Globisporangium splendens]